MDPNNKKDGGKKLTIDEKQDGVGGRITLNEDVVATIAGLAARAVEGIHALGKSRLIPFGDSPTRGVAAEVGSKQAAFDIDVVIDYGRDIRKVASELRQKISSEVNINVIDIRLPEEEKPMKVEPKSRVQ